MLTWSSCVDSFYRYVLENEFSKRSNKPGSNNIFNNIIDASCSNITVYRNNPRSSDYYEDHLFSIPDSTLDPAHIDSKHGLLNSTLNLSKVIHKSQGNHSSRRINNFYYSSGNKRNSIYSTPYEHSQYSNVNLSRYETKSNPRVNVFKSLEHEIVNCVDTLYLYDKRRGGDVKPVILKPSGVLNAGIMGLELNTELLEGDVYIDVNEILAVYPSCFFSYEENCSNLFMEPFKESNTNHKIETSWDGYTLKSRIYNVNRKIKSVNEEADILEIKSDNKSMYSSTIYARNPLGMFVFRYYFDGEWKLRPLNNVSYKPEEKIYYISVSPYLSDEAIFLKTNNELLVYDGHKAHERDRVRLSSYLKSDEDLVHTVCYGMDNNSLILGGSKLYCMDKRAATVSPLLLTLPPSLTITSTKWTERNYDVDHPSRHYNKLLSGRYCSFSSYYRRCSQTFWKSFTAMEVHPLHNYVLAAVCGTSNSILIIDLRIPNTPLLDVPIASAEFIGSRFRSIKWQCDKKESLLFVFSWRQKYPICIRVEIDSCFTSYSIVSEKEYGYDDFVNSDVEYDTSIRFDRTMLLNFTSVDESEEEKDFSSSGPLIETQREYSDHEFSVTKDVAMTNIFHGYSGVSCVMFPKINVKLVLVYTTSGRLLCLDVNNRKIVLIRKDDDRYRNKSDMDFGDEADSFIGFNTSLSRTSGIAVPEDLEFDSTCKYLKIRKSKIENIYTGFEAINVHDNFVKIQEQHFGDNRMNVCLSINNCYVSDFKNDRTEKYNSREILERILSFDVGNDRSSLIGGTSRNDVNDYNEDVLSVSRFTYLYGIENIDLYNVWNPLAHKLDYEYETEHKNSFIKDPQLCSCSALNESIFEQYTNMFKTIFDCIHDKHNDNSEPSMVIASQQDRDVDAIPPVSSDGIQKMLIEKLNRKQSLVVDKGVASAFGDMLLLQSTMSRSVSSDLPNDAITSGVGVQGQSLDEFSDSLSPDRADAVSHREDCAMKDILCVSVDTDVDEVESIPIVDQILSSWLPEHRDLAKPDTRSFVNRVFKPGDTVEHLKEYKRKQRQLISRILTSMETKN